MRNLRRARAALLAPAALLAAACAPGAARAANLQTLDPAASTPAHLAVNAAGAAVVAWTSTSGSDQVTDFPMVCVIPRGGRCTAPQKLTIPGADGSADELAGLFPVAGAGNTITLVGPRFGHQDVLRWTSTDGGAHFGAPTDVANAYPAMTTPEDVVTTGATTLIGASNPGLGLGALGATTGNVAFDAGDDVDTSATALDAAGRPVRAYFTLGDTADQDQLSVFRYKGTGNLLNPANWKGPTPVAAGYEPVLAGGPGGLFMVSQDPHAGATTPTILDVRKDDGTAFGAPTALSDDASVDLFDDGAAAESPSGHLAVVWPGPRPGDNLKVLRLWTSTDGGATFSAEADVADIVESYLPNRNAQVTLADDGTGWVTFRDGGGLELADLTPVAPFVPPAPDPGPPQPVTTPIAPGVPPQGLPPAGPVYNPSRGPYATTTTTVGSDVVSLQTPRGCVRSGTVVARLSVRARRRKGHVVIKVGKVQFKYDNRIVSVKRHRPFTLRFKVAVTPGSRHTISARVFIRTHGRPITRTLRNAFHACGA